MAGSLNLVVIIGRLGQDPESRSLPNGQTVTTLTVATDESYQDRDGQRQSRTEWHRVVCWGKTAETAKRYLSKGRMVNVTGRLQTRSWDKDGEKRYSTEIVADRLNFLDSGEQGGGSRGAAPQGGYGGGAREVDRHRPKPTGRGNTAPPVENQFNDDDIRF